MLTDAGKQLLLDALKNPLAGATITVFNLEDGTEATKTVDDGFPTIDGSSVILQATFQSDEANFAWERYEVTVGDRIIDMGDSDQGRKVEGSVWVFAVAIDFLPEDG
jgi:hypothetical protein